MEWKRFGSCIPSSQIMSEINVTNNSSTERKGLDWEIGWSSIFKIAVGNNRVSSCGTAQFSKSYAEVQWFETVTVVTPSRPIASSVRSALYLSGYLLLPSATRRDFRKKCIVKSDCKLFLEIKYLTQKLCCYICLNIVVSGSKQVFIQIKYDFRRLKQCLAFEYEVF